MSELNVLQKTNKVGEQILQNQVMGKSDGYSHVNKSWVKRCLKFDDVIQQTQKFEDSVSDIVSPFSSWLPTIDNGIFKLEYKPTGKKYSLNQHSMTNLSYYAGISSTLPCDFLTAKRHATKTDEKTGEKKIVYQRDSRDAEVLKTLFLNTLFSSDRGDLKKNRLFRVRDDGTIRAILSEKYAIVPNTFVLETLREVIHEGLVSHYRSTSDYIKGNILISDTIRDGGWTDFGAMVHFGNDEIGKNRLYTQSSIFTAICFNGCIWGEENGVSISRKHIGKIDLKQMRKLIRDNIERQIPLLKPAIDKFLTTRALKFQIPILNVFTQLAQDYSFSRKEIIQVIRDFAVEKDIIGGDVFSCYGLIAAITRAGQNFDDSTWENFDKIGGKLIMEENKWNKFIDRAKYIDNQMIEKVLGVAV